MKQACVWGCRDGACVAPLGEACDERMNAQNYLREDGGCLLECRDGSFQESSFCSSGLRFSTYNNESKLLTYRALSRLPSHLFDGMDTHVRFTWQPSVYSGFGSRATATWRTYDVINLSADSSEEVIIHEFFHAWAGNQRSTYPVYFPLAPVVSSLQGGNPIPSSYVQLIGCSGEGTYTYTIPPVTGYGGLPAEEISCYEDFADSAAWYVTNACLLQLASPERYEYFRDTIFGGEEYIPAGGCTFE